MFDRTVAETSAATSLGRLGRFMCSLLAALCLALLATLPALAQTAQPRTVNFLSADGKTNLVGYLFAPAGRPKTNLLLSGTQFSQNGGLGHTAGSGGGP